MSPLWRLKSLWTSSSGRVSVVAATALLIGGSVFESPAWAGRDKPPVANKDLAVTEAGSKVKIRVLANDFDPDGTKVRLKRVKKPSKGRVRKSKKGVINYTPDESAEGTDSFRYVIKDRNGKGKKARGRVEVKILANSDPGGGGDNDPPVADAGPNRNVTVGQSTTLDGSGSSDPNGDPLTYSWSLVSWPTGSTADFANSTKKKPVFVADMPGTFIAELVVYDGIIRSAADRVEIVATANTPPPPPPGQTFAELCEHSSVLRCVGSDVDMSEANYNNSNSKPIPVRIDNGVFFEGGGSELHTVNDNVNYDTSGTTGYSFPQVSSGSVFISWRMRFGDGLATMMQNGEWGVASGMKFLQVTAGGRSCSSEEITVADHFRYSLSTGSLEISHTCSAILFGGGDDWQPGGTLGNCGWRYFDSQRSKGKPTQSPPCHLLQDDTWHLLTLEIQVGKGVKFWIDDVLAIDSPRDQRGNPAQGPYGQVWLNTYATGHHAGDNGGGTWRVWYDNLIISTECVTGCGS